MDRTTHPNFVPDNTAGSRQETAVLLVGTADEFGVPQRDIASTQGGYWISDTLADVLYDEAEDEAEAEPKKTAKTQSRKKTSGNRAEEINSEKEE